MTSLWLGGGYMRRRMLRLYFFGVKDLKFK